MARVFREICRCDGVCGPDIPCGENGINDLLSPSLAACSAEEKTLPLTFPLRSLMLNPKGTLHGGIMTTMLDMAMGMLARYERKANLVSTVSLSVDFLRPVHGAPFVQPVPGGNASGAVGRIGTDKNGERMFPRAAQDG